MQIFHPSSAARAALAASVTRPATTVLFDSPDARLVAFRLRPGQRVVTHRNTATVLLPGTSGTGVVQGANGERACGAGDLVVFDPHEVHGMCADAAELLLLAILAPAPGARATISPPRA
jgi:quercetin dioxygenase-like cupin family protein